MALSKDLSLALLSDVVLLLLPYPIVLQSVIHHLLLLQRLVESSDFLKSLLFLFQAFFLVFLDPLRHLNVERLSIG